MLSKLALAAQVPDYHYSGSDAYTHGKRFSCASFKPCDGSNDIQCSSHRTFGIVLVRNGIAEIRQDAVAAKVGEKTVIRARDTSTSSVIGIYDGAHIFRIKAC